MVVEIGDGPIPDPTPQQEDLRFLPSGKIQVSVNGATHMLRRPKFGEFRHFREALYEEQDRAHEDLLKKADALVIEANAEAEEGVIQKTPEQRRDELREIVDAARKVRTDTERQEAAYVQWSRVVIETLSGRSIDVDDDDLPFLFGTNDFIVAVQRHWRTVPLPSGVR